LPPTKLLDSKVIESMVGEGCILKECTVKRSVIGVRSRIETGCLIDNALLMGADYYESPQERAKNLESGKVPLGIGANTTIHRAIVDKNARIGRNVRIVKQRPPGGDEPGKLGIRHSKRNRRRHQERDHSGWNGHLGSL
jgi:glucose-1-phosphate adenylyltransferase